MEQLLTKLGENGAFALLLAIALWAIYHLYNKLMEVQEKRVKEGLVALETMTGNTQAIKDLTRSLRAAGHDGHE